MEKTCFKCKRTLALINFYKHPQMGDGHLNKCKDCARKDVAAHREQKLKDPEWVEKEKMRCRKKGIISSLEHPQIHRSRRATRSLRRTPGYHWHHWSYKEEHKIDCILLTEAEHRRAHRFLVLDYEHMMYRRYDTMELLDTRDRHESFLKETESNPF